MCVEVHGNRTTQVVPAGAVVTGPCRCGPLLRTDVGGTGKNERTSLGVLRDKRVMRLSCHELCARHSAELTDRCWLTSSVAVSLGIAYELILADESIVKEEELVVVVPDRVNTKLAQVKDALSPPVPTSLAGKVDPRAKSVETRKTRPDARHYRLVAFVGVSEERASVVELLVVGMGLQHVGLDVGGDADTSFVEGLDHLCKVGVSLFVHGEHKTVALVVDGVSRRKVNSRAGDVVLLAHTRPPREELLCDGGVALAETHTTGKVSQPVSWNKQRSTDEVGELGCNLLSVLTKDDVLFETTPVLCVPLEHGPRLVDQAADIPVGIRVGSRIDTNHRCERLWVAVDVNGLG